MKNNGLLNVGKLLSKTAGKVEFKIKKRSPEILLGIGVVGFIGTVVVACKETLRADEVLEYHKEKMRSIHEAKEIVDQNPEEELEYDESLYRLDIVKQYAKTGGRIIKLYAPAIALGGLSLTCIFASRNIMNKRYLGVVAAYNGVSAAFDTYRKRVIEEEGKLKDHYYRYGSKIEEVSVEDPKNDGKSGKKNKKTELQEKISQTDILPNDASCRFFDSSNPNWDSNPSFSMMFLRGQQNIFNDILHTRGHVFLNEVYEALGFDHTPEGAVMGWVDGEGDSYIDFGLYDKEKDVVRKFVNGTDNVILLEFNHDGIIWDKI